MEPEPTVQKKNMQPRAAIHSLSLPLTSPHEIHLTVMRAVGNKVLPDPRISDCEGGKGILISS